MMHAGVAVLAGYALHALHHLGRGEPQHLLWVCHLATLLIGTGLLVRHPMSVGAGTLVLCLGTPLWLIGLAQGQPFAPTSLGTHGLGLVVGLWGVWQLGMPRGASWMAVVCEVASIGLSRVAGPAESNVNLAFAAPQGMGAQGTSHAVALAVFVVLSALGFRAVEALLRRAAGAVRPPESLR